MLLYKMSLQQYNNALSQYQNGADGMKNYIKGKSDMLKDKAVGARDQAMGKAQAALANALQIDQGKKEQLENTIGTMAIAGPVIVKGVKQLGGKIAQYKAGTTPVETETAATSIDGESALLSNPRVSRAVDASDVGGEGADAGGDILAGGGTGSASAGYAEAGEETTGTIARLPTASSGPPEYGTYDDLTGGEEEDDELGDQLFGQGEGPQAERGFDIPGLTDEPEEPTFSTQYGNVETSGVESSGVESSAAETNPFTSAAGGFEDKGYSGDGSTIGTQSTGEQAATAAEQSTVTTAESTGAEATESIAEGIGGEIAGAGSEAIGAGVTALAGAGGEAAAAAAAAAAAGGEAVGAGLAAAAAGAAAVAMPLVAVGAVGYELYNLFHHSSHKDTTPAAPPPMAFTGSGIKDTFTSGGFAAASTDGVTTSVSSNSAF